MSRRARQQLERLEARERYVERIAVKPRAVCVPDAAFNARDRALRIPRNKEKS